MYGYLNKLVSIEEAVDQIAAEPNSPVDAFADLIRLVSKKIEGGRSNIL